ncbi:hydratase [Rhizobium sp. S95]|uniref:Hydratase n=1 Tax=Ciceribacter sichuanensis TaxID=2949647 RepID=A0AAJ1C0J3_9HYPH|nr:MULTISPECIES: hydratase [unclassified Ciceribacter]MCM2397280.1 hydratase [Ciceribacter sp. S95]MCO5959070.1 hydratase [Ciceribacter sp. S101]
MSPTFDPTLLATSLMQAKARIPANTLVAPSTIAEAFAVQTITMADAPAEPVGYKVARSPDGIAVTGRLLPLHIVGDATFPWRAGVAIEAEIAVRLATALPPRAGGYTRDEVKKAVGSVHLGLEVLDSRLVEGSKSPYLLFLSDRLGNAGYLLGPEVPSALVDDVAGTPLEVTLGDAIIFADAAKHPAGDVLAWLVDWANREDRPEGSLAAGEIITTGSLCGAVPLATSGLLTITLGTDHQLTANFAG